MLDSKRILVTGGGSGIGRASALCFGTQSAQLVVADIDRVAAEETCDLLERAGATKALVPPIGSGELFSLMVNVISSVSAPGGIDRMNRPNTITDPPAGPIVVSARGSSSGSVESLPQPTSINDSDKIRIVNNNQDFILPPIFDLSYFLTFLTRI